MPALAPAGASCAQHLEVPASGTCNRCGNFMCTACECRVRPDATPMCPACFALRSQKVQPQSVPSSTRLHTAGFVLGLVSLLPIAPVVIVSIVVNCVALVKTRTPETRAVRWKPIVGLCLSLFWPVVLVLGVIGFKVFH